MNSSHCSFCKSTGVASDFFGFFVNPQTGLPYGFTRRGVGNRFPCVGNTGLIYEILPRNVQAGRYGSGDKLYYELTTPRATKMAQNFFACERVTGLRLENQPTSGGDFSQCIGGHPVDERLLSDEIMGAVTNEIVRANRISPFTMAVLEDSGTVIIVPISDAAIQNC